MQMHPTFLCCSFISSDLLFMNLTAIHSRHRRHIDLADAMQLPSDRLPVYHDKTSNGKVSWRSAHAWLLVACSARIICLLSWIFSSVLIDDPTATWFSQRCFLPFGSENCPVAITLVLALTLNWLCAVILPWIITFSRLILHSWLIFCAFTRRFYQGTLARYLETQWHCRLYELVLSGFHLHIPTSDLAYAIKQKSLTLVRLDV